MQTKPKPIIYLSLTSSKLLYPVFYRERETFYAQKLLFVRSRTTKRLDKQAASFKCPTKRFEVFPITRKANEKRKHTKYNHKSGAKRTNFRLQFW